MPSYKPCPKCSAQVPEGARFCQRCGATQGSGSGSRGASQKSAAGFRPSFVLIALVLVAVVVTGSIIGIQRMHSHQAASANMDAGSTGAMKVIDEAGPMPGWLAQADKAMLTEYTWAASHHNELQYIPCYCGCNANAGHMSNSECYYRRGQDGRITAYDQHAYG